ncbi:hypothetical protein DFR72_117123 [Lentzea flaviverrucosa]|uniref:Uncharacterized protein n=1 Tax=Lentzea flaviverrucosa TaxID=200379 RepID=A0A1H9XTW1_9PSEU|nr:hypothetical protein DFR72_117123 [Lentzea flaviverrucosa]SES49157.1 hypothetical protein SAMN05216195_11795 [Lentzea flaviverrucosa]
MRRCGGDPNVTEPAVSTAMRVPRKPPCRSGWSTTRTVAPSAVILARVLAGHRGSVTHTNRYPRLAAIMLSATPKLP